MREEGPAVVACGLLPQELVVGGAPGRIGREPRGGLLRVPHPQEPLRERVEVHPRLGLVVVYLLTCPNAWKVHLWTLVLGQSRLLTSGSRSRRPSPPRQEARCGP